MSDLHIAQPADGNHDVDADASEATTTAHRVVFLPSGRTSAVADGTTVLDAARRLGVDLDSVCGGRGICGRCQVVVPVGSFPKWNVTTGEDALDVPGSTGRLARPLVDGQILGCAAKIRGDVVVDIPATSQVHRPIVRKDLGDADFEVDPRYTLYYVEPILDPTEDQPDGPTSAFAAVRRSLQSDHGVTATQIRAELLPGLQPALASSARGITVAVTNDTNGRPPGEIVGVWPGLIDTTFGVAVDVGSTTIAAHLVDLGSGASAASRGIMNPQIRFGEDLMSRVSYVMMNPGGTEELTATVRAAIAELVVGLVADVAIDDALITDIVVVGNPIMHHLVLGIDPTPLGQAPFTLATTDPVVTAASELDLGLPGAEVYVGPCIAGHVGADTAAAILADGPQRGERWRLLVDVGTNAEIVLGNSTTVLAASSPTGPAFEGAQISHGQRATSGAIDRVRIDPATASVRFSVIGVDPWSDEPGFAAAVDPANGGPGITGICGSGIIDALAEMFLAGYLLADGTITDPTGMPDAAAQRVVADGRTHSFVVYDEPRVVITQNDVRAVQLAKAALRAGIDLLVDRAGNPTIESIALAGAFGAHIDPLRAMVLGLIPDAPIDGVRSVGNAAGAGAVAALVSMTARSEMETTAASVIKVETATEPTFQERFVAAMALPHASADHPHLEQLVTLPPPTSAPAGTTGRDGRPRRRSARGAGR